MRRREAAATGYALPLLRSASSVAASSLNRTCLPPKMAPERTRRRTQPIRASKIKHHAPPPVATPGSSNPGYVHDTLSGQFVQRRRDTGQLGRDRKTGRFTRKSSTTPPAATRDEATSKEALGAEAGRTANAYLAVTEQFARDLDHTYTILDRFETDRVLLSLATAVVADIAEWVFLMHTLGSRYSPDAILLHGGAVSRRILGRVASDWHARSQLEQARRRIRAVSPSQLFLQAPVRLTPPSRVNSGQSVAALPMSNVSAGTSSTSLSLPPSKHRNIQIIRNIQLAQGNLVLGIATARSHRARSQVLGTFSGRRR